MKKITHKAASRGYADHGWLKSYHTFSFANYYDPARVHFGMLRVLNDDIIEGGEGFGTHPHANMEIITIPIKGAIQHKDSMGNGSVIRPSEVQIMSAGTGIQHSEYNASQTEEGNFLQLWIFPKEKNIQPRYDQKKFSLENIKNKFQTIVSPEKNGEALWINQDAYLSLGKFNKDLETNYTIKKQGNGVYIFVIEGEIEAEGEFLHKRDAIGISETEKIYIKTFSPAEVLLIDVPMHG